MKRIVSVVFAAGAALAISAGAAQAQINVGVGGGVTIPTSDFGDVGKTGWHGIAHVGYGLPSGVGIRGEFFYGENKFDPSGGKFKLAGGLGSLSYEFGVTNIKPYIIGSAGVMQFKADPDAGGAASETKFTFGGGAGVKFKAGSDASVFVEGRYLSINTSGNNANFIPVTVGVSFGLK
jgi:opacity protein-like surface antigen